ncbi:MAG TPA: arylsulfotransferase family protein [Gaiellaceae bacterium]
MTGLTRAEFLARSAAFALAPSVQVPPRFISRPDLDPPPVTILHAASGTAPGLLFLAPSSGPGQRGPLILDDAGRPVWCSAAGLPAMNFRAQTLHGEPVLTWWQALPGGLGHGVHVVADASYREIARFPAGHGRPSDLHELLLTDRGTALVTSFEIRHRGARGLTMGGVVQELEVPSARVLFEWRSLDHVPVGESHAPVGYPWDYFHVNSVDVDADGNLIVSARNTWAVYKVHRRTGAVLWRLGGKRSDFALGPGARFALQHDARSHEGGRVLSIFDNGVSRSRGIVLGLDTKRMRASLRHEYVHRPALHAHKLGSVQLLGNGDVLVGWGTNPHFTEFAESGPVKLDATLPHGGENYRTLRFPWRGRPRDQPVAVRRGSNVYASWNGATDVAAWKIEPAGPTVATTGFETALPLRAGTVVALDARGRALGRYRLP